MCGWRARHSPWKARKGDGLPDKTKWWLFICLAPSFEGGLQNTLMSPFPRSVFPTYLSHGRISQGVALQQQLTQLLNQCLVAKQTHLTPFLSTGALILVQSLLLNEKRKAVLCVSKGQEVVARGCPSVKGFYASSKKSSFWRRCQDNDPLLQGLRDPLSTFDGSRDWAKTDEVSQERNPQRSKGP